MIDTATATAFLAQRRIAVVGASDDKASFGGTIYRALRDHGYDVVAVNPNAEAVADDPCYPDLAAVPTPVDGAIVMVSQANAPGVVQDCVEQRVPRVWLFKGLGGPGALSDQAVKLCEDNGIDVVAGACPLMFLEPVGVPHRVHRALRRLNGSLARVS